MVRSYVVMLDLIDVWQGDPISIHRNKYQKVESPTYLGFCHVFLILNMFCQRKTIKTNVEIVNYDPVT